MQRQGDIRFGVNYVPAKKWWYSWLDWDKQAVAEDLLAIAGLGMDHVRIHCLWDVFQPNPHYVSKQALEKLVELLDVADYAKLDVEVTVLDGWLSGFAFFPAWRKRANIFTDPDTIKAEKLLFKELASVLRYHPRFLGFDTGNEINVLTGFGNAVTVAEGDAWLEEMMAYCEELVPDKLHVTGVDHNPWFSDKVYSRELLSTSGSVTSLHTWIEFTGASQRYRPMDIGCLHLVEYNIEFAKAYNTDHDRLIWIQEFGASGEWMHRELIPKFAEKTIRNAASCNNVWGFTWWCSHDIDQAFSGFDKLEYDLGLFDTHNKVKPVGQQLAKLIQEFRESPPDVIERSVALVFPDRLFTQLQEQQSYHYPNNPGWDFGKHYMDLIADGIRPAIVLESKTHDKEYLNRRQIKELRYTK